jgi:hypothetical protein
MGGRLKVHGRFVGADTVGLHFHRVSLCVHLSAVNHPLLWRTPNRANLGDSILL